MSRPVPELPETRRVWDEVGKRDPMNSILPGPGGTGAAWTAEDFFATGRRSVDIVFRRLEELGVKVSPGTALDFGCGVGRLTQALAPRFTTTYGIDVAPSMVAEAERLNAHRESCHYQVNPSEDLGLIGTATVDFVLSDVVLQHIRPQVAAGYVAEFLRILRPGGVAVFYLPGERIHRGPGAPFIAAYNKIRYGTTSTLNYGVDPKIVGALVGQSGSRVLEVRTGDWLDRGQGLTAPPPGLTTRLWVVFTYVFSDQWERSTYLVRKEL